MSHRPNHIYEFGPYRMEGAERMLLRNGEAIPLQPKAFDLLRLLVEHHGRLLEKDELLKAIWPDTVVEEVNLANNISVLRKALGDGENGQKYIETVPKRGYRFVAEVREIGAEQVEINEVVARNPEGESQQDPLARKIKLHRKGAHLALAVSIIGFGGIGFGLYKFINRPQTKSSGPEPKIIPFTSFPGEELQPTFSPDGNQIAFVWRNREGSNADIYVKLIDSETPLRLTTDPAADAYPAWSPDGRHIAFLRQFADRSVVYLVPAIGGAERKLAEVAANLYSSFESGYQGCVLSQSLSWSPTGESLAVVDKSSPSEPYSIFLLSRETGEKRRLTYPPAEVIGDGWTVFSPDGKTLAFVRLSGVADADIYVLPLNGGAPKRLTFGKAGINGLTWTPDGRDIFFSLPRSTGARFGLWKISANGGAPEQVVRGLDVPDPTISSRGNRLAFTQIINDYNVWRIGLTGSRNQNHSMTPLISSTQIDAVAHYSPDGKKIVFGSTRSGSPELWLCEADGSHPVQLTNLHANIGAPRWSSDSRKIAFDLRVEGNSDIYVISADGGQPRRLTVEPSEDMVPSWSQDGRWIYFGSNRSGSLQIWKMPAEGGQAVQVTRQGGFEAIGAPDGKFLYYAKGRRLPGIWRIPVEGGEETPVLDYHQAGFWRAWNLTEQGIYFATAENPSRPLIEFFSFTTGKVTQIASLEKPFFLGLSVSPDGRWLIYSQLDQSGSDIMLMENFR
ncbi:MAG: winged helix-turn-helix domain-containing protein [Acidobacteria bacterium]|nr:winged helix-turn-helix domain-containing protein [Acidobacteriota bacterium]